jgi:hypothetical protein
VLVVVPDVAVEHAAQVSFVDDEQPVGAFSPVGAE